MAGGIIEQRLTASSAGSYAREKQSRGNVFVREYCFWKKPGSEITIPANRVFATLAMNFYGDGTVTIYVNPCRRHHICNICWPAFS
jgi:hypothetical protein